MSYWYHFAILFEALFILTTIDAGTRVARYVLQELLGKVYPPFEQSDSIAVSSVVASIVIVGSWVYFILTGSVATIWPMFGIANQLLAVIALTVGSMVIINMGKTRYVWVTGLPLAFVSTTTLTAGWQSISQNFIPLAQQPGKAFIGFLNAGLTALHDGLRSPNPCQRARSPKTVVGMDHCQRCRSPKRESFSRTPRPKRLGILSRHHCPRS